MVWLQFAPVQHNVTRALVSLLNGISIRSTALAGCTSVTDGQMDGQTDRQTTLWKYMSQKPTLLMFSAMPPEEECKQTSKCTSSHYCEYDTLKTNTQYKNLFLTAYQYGDYNKQT